MPRVVLLGPPAIQPSGQEDGSAQPRGRKSWAVLARIALSDRPVLRRVLATELFEEAEDPLAALRWNLADLRRSLRLPTALHGDPLRLDRTQLSLDVWELEDGLLGPGDLTGELLDGAVPRNSPRFEAWLLLTRARCTRRCREQVREEALRALADGDAERAVEAAQVGALLDPLDETAQELLLRALVAAGRPTTAAQHLAACEREFARAGLPMSPSTRAAAVPRPVRTASGIRAGIVASALLRAGSAALDAGAADAGIETLRRAAEDASRANDPGIESEVLQALGGALVHAVRGSDGEGAIVLHRALRASRSAGRPSQTAEVLRELAFVDVQAGRHDSAARALGEAREALGHADDPALEAGLLAVEGMNAADRGRHGTAAGLLRRSASIARDAGQERQRVWSLGVLARSLLLLDRTAEARRAAEESIEGAQRNRWHAFLPWPQAIRAECAARQDDWPTAAQDAEEAFALGCELGDPCWEGMAARALALVAAHDGDTAGAWEWTVDARDRCDRVPDRYVWISAYIAHAQLDLAHHDSPAEVPRLAARLLDDASRTDLPEFEAWALLSIPGALDRARLVAAEVDSPRLRERLSPSPGP